MTGTVPSFPLVRVIDKAGMRARDFSALSGVSEREVRAWRRGEHDASWWHADAVLQTLGLHWWDVWPRDTEGGRIARALWEGDPEWVVACAACGLEDARTGDRREAEGKRCLSCKGVVHVVDEQAAVAS